MNSQISELLTTNELAHELEQTGLFTADQAYLIASDVYEPLVDVIKSMAKSIERMESK